MERHILLVGYRGSGKSTVARELARLLGLPRLDTDQLIEASAGRSIQQLFAERGEAGFRDLETECLLSLRQQPASVVSLGGGAVVRPGNRPLIGSLGTVIWLDGRPETLTRRIAGDPRSAQTRPALTDGSLEQEVIQLLAQREPWYREVADHRIEVDDASALPIAESIRMWLQSQTDQP